MRAIWKTFLGVLVLIGLAFSSLAEEAWAAAPSPEAYVTSLYRSYLDLMSGEPAERVLQAEQNRKERQWRLEWLTPRFNANWRRLGEETDADPVLMAQDTGDDWSSTMRVQVLTRTPTRAAVLVVFPDEAWGDYQLLAHIIRVGDRWKLDAVTTSPRDIADGKHNASPSQLDMSHWDYGQTKAALLSWATSSRGMGASRLTELSRCRFREHNEFTRGRRPISLDEDFDIGTLHPERMAPENWMMKFSCAPHVQCVAWTFSDHRGREDQPFVEIYFSDRRGPDVIAAVKHLAALCGAN